MTAGPTVHSALPYGPEDEAAMADGTRGTTRALGRFDAHGDPDRARVWLWRAAPDGRPGRELPPGG